MGPKAVLAAAGFLACAPDAFAACDITGGAVSCTANTTTSDTTNPDAASASSSDRFQDYLASGAITGSVAGGVTVDGAGLAIENAGPGDLSFVNSGAINQTTPASTASSGALSLWAHSGNLTYSGSGSIATSTEPFALFLNAEGAGNITAHLNGGITDSLTNSYAVFVQTSTTGNIAIDGSGNLSAATGISVSSAGPGNVTIGGSGNIAFLGGSGVSVTSTGPGTVTVNRSGTITGTTASGGIVVDNNGIGSTVISGTGAIAIISGSGILTGGTANTTITPGAAITADYAGISAQHTGNSAVTINSAFDITAPTAILASSLNGPLSVNISGGTITAASGLNVASYGTGNVSVVMTGGAIHGGSGIQASSLGSGAIAVTLSGAIISTSATSSAISTSAAGGATVIVNNAAVTGATTTQGVVNAASTGGAIAITNGINGAIASTAGNPQSQLAVQTIGGATTLNNGGTLTGLVRLGNAANVISNSGTWKTSGVNSFGGGNSRFSNSGILNTGKDAATSFTTTGTLSFDNSGTFNVLGATNIGTAIVSNNAGGVIAVGAGQTLTLNGGAGALNNGGMLTGGGTVAGNIIVASGGTFAPGTPVPGTFMANTGTLVLQPGSIYGVTLNGDTSTLAKVSGTATLAGDAKATFLPDAYVQKAYTILTSSGLNGAFSGFTTSNLPAGFNAALSYDAKNAYLSLTAALTPPTPAGAGPSPVNQQNVVGTLNNYFNAGGALPPAFVTVYGLSGASLSTALNQLSGESGAAMANEGSQRLAPFMDALSDRLSDIGAANGIRPAQLGSTTGIRSWASAFGGHQHTEGDAIAGSHDSHADVLGLAIGIDADVWPELTVGTSLAGGRSNFGIDQDLGHSGGNMMELGGYAYGRFEGDSYLSAALAYAWQDLSTRRLVTIGGTNSQLGASFNAQNYGARLEGGQHLHLDDTFTLTPFVGLLWDEFDIPAYAEGALSGSASYALGYAAQSAPRSGVELGTRFARQTANDTSALTWDGHLAWRHNFEIVETSQVSFLALPGSSFVVDGAKLDSDTALLSLGLTWKIRNQTSFGVKADASIGPRSQTFFGGLTVSRDW